MKTYSRDMLQRTGIAAAILHGPELVILDEPMNGLDPIGRREFRDLILELKGDGATVFLSSHVLADIESTADRVGILDRGRLVQSGPLGEILSRDGRRVEIVFEIPAGASIDRMETGLESVRPATRGWMGTCRKASSRWMATRCWRCRCCRPSRCARARSGSRPLRAKVPWP